MKYVLRYLPADDVAEKAPLHFAAHRERIDEFHARGVLLMIGPFRDAASQGSMAVFTTREAAEEFAAKDPFVVEGVVRSSEIREWDEVLA